MIFIGLYRQYESTIYYLVRSFKIIGSINNLDNTRTSSKWKIWSSYLNAQTMPSWVLYLSTCLWKLHFSSFIIYDAKYLSLVLSFLMGNFLDTFKTKTYLSTHNNNIIIRSCIHLIFVHNLYKKSCKSPQYIRTLSEKKGKKPYTYIHIHKYYNNLNKFILTDTWIKQVKVYYLPYSPVT